VPGRAVPGNPVRQEFEYRRHGTAVLFAAWVTDSTRSENFVEFLRDLVAQTPKGLDLHCIVDNLSAHGTPMVEAFLDEHRHVFLHRTPTHASWLNQVELFFSILERKVIRNGNFTPREDLTAKLLAFISDYDQTAKPFAWTGNPLKWPDQHARD
jgi:transposase